MTLEGHLALRWQVLLLPNFCILVADGLRKVEGYDTINLQEKSTGSACVI